MQFVGNSKQLQTSLRRVECLTNFLNKIAYNLIQSSATMNFEWESLTSIISHKPKNDFKPATLSLVTLTSLGYPGQSRASGPITKFSSRDDVELGQTWLYDSGWLMLFLLNWFWSTHIYASPPEHLRKRLSSLLHSY